MAGADPETRVTFGDVFAVREFRALWFAQLLSLIGDQLAIVALTWLVFRASDSPFLAAAAYAISFLPWVIGGPLLSGLADRLPRREVMVVCDAARAGLMLVMAIPGMPIWSLCVLLFTTELLSPPFSAARAALMPDVLPGDRYVVGTAVNNITIQTGQVIGFATAGAVVAVLDPSGALAVNAATFLVSGVLLASQVTSRPAARNDARPLGSSVADALAGLRLIAGNPRLRTLTALALLSALYIVPEGLAAPYATALGGGSRAAGVLLAAGPFGAAMGAFVFSRYVSPSDRLRMMGPLAVLSCASLVACVFRPGLLGSLAIFALSGAASAYQLAANAAFVTAVPAASRGQAFGLVTASMTVSQGFAIVLAGAVAERAQPALVITAAGGIGCLAALLLSAAWRSSVRHGDA